MAQNRLIQYIFFFGSLGLVGFMVWQIFAPFIAALALAGIIVVITYPMYEFLVRNTPRQNASVAALLSTLIVFFVIVIPTFFVSSLLISEFVSFYRALDSSGELAVDQMLIGLEQTVQLYVPGFDINMSEQVRQSVAWFTRNIGTIFAGTVSVIFTFLISMLGSFYLFRDGDRLIKWVISVSPLPDKEDKIILTRIGQAIRSVATGTVLLSIIQGIVAALGFSIFGVERAILWGSIAALGALLPGIGTAGIMIPAVGYLFFLGEPVNAIGLLIWGVIAIGVVDNFIGPYLMSRGNNLHPFVILISVLGGISLFGPIGFILGPVFISLFMVLLEIYNSYFSVEVQRSRIPKKRS